MSPWSHVSAKLKQDEGERTQQMQREWGRGGNGNWVTLSRQSLEIYSVKGEMMEANAHTAGTVFLDVLEEDLQHVVRRHGGERGQTNTKTHRHARTRLAGGSWLVIQSTSIPHQGAMSLTTASLPHHLCCMPPCPKCSPQKALRITAHVASVAATLSAHTHLQLELAVSEVGTPIETDERGMVEVRVRARGLYLGKCFADACSVECS